MKIALVIVVAAMFTGCISIGNRTTMKDFSSFNDTCLNKWRLSVRECEQFWINYSYSVQSQRPSPMTIVAVSPNSSNTLGYRDDVSERIWANFPKYSWNKTQQ